MLDNFRNAISDKIRARKKTGSDTDIFDDTLKVAGFAYDPEQDVFYSRTDAWQKNYGYCQLYDEANTPLNMIIDCEPIHFEYGDKKWLIELWKGQYGMTTGGEIGVYSTKGPDLKINGIFNGTFYHSVADEDYLDMSLFLSKSDKPLFSRGGRHWWMTGFKLGEFSEPEDLIMDAGITLKDSSMRDAFINELENLGYNDIKVLNNTVRIVFAEPHSKQPLSRTKPADWLIQRKNQLLCEQYQKLTGTYQGSKEKIIAIKKDSPVLYNLIFNMGKPKQLFMMNETLIKYLVDITA